MHAVLEPVVSQIASELCGLDAETTQLHPGGLAHKWTAQQVFEVTGHNPKLEIALELERIALEDDYFIKRKLYPNVDFYSGIIYQAVGFKPEMFTVLFAIPRTVGWLAQWQELINDPEQKIARPRQIYLGHEVREFVPMAKRKPVVTAG